jgi:zinc resistance-associated protein
VKKRRQDFFTILHFLFEIPSYGSVRKATTTILQNLTGGKKMKKRTLVILGLVLSLSLIASGSAFARWGGGYGMMGGGYARGGGDCYVSDVDPEVMAKFQKETLSLRDELVTKQLELRQEYNKETTDADRIAELRKDMIDIQTKIQKVAEKYDIDRGGQGRQARAGKGRGNADCRGGCY